MIIRDFTEADVAPANALVNDVILQTPIHFATAPATDAEFAAMWNKSRENFPWLAAEDSGGFLGYCKAGTWRERDAYSRTVETAVYVVSNARRRGTGRALYQELFARLRDGGFRTAVAGITLPNEASVLLHEAMGFQHVGVFKAVGFKFDAWHDVGFWQIDFETPQRPAP